MREKIIAQFKAGKI